MSFFHSFCSFSKVFPIHIGRTRMELYSYKSWTWEKKYTFGLFIHN